MSTQFLDLSHPLRDGGPVYPGDPALRIAPHFTIPEERCNVSRLHLGSHTGTHLDAMRHFYQDGKTLDEMPLEWFVGPARVLRIPKKARQEIDVDDFLPYEQHLLPEAKIILDTGWGARFHEAEFFTDFPSLTIAAARFLAAKKIRMLGMDMPTPSRDGYEVHRILLAPESEIVIVESLNNLHLAPDVFTLIALPLALHGLDGSPIRAVALIEEEQ